MDSALDILFKASVEASAKSPASTVRSKRVTSTVEAPRAVSPPAAAASNLPVDVPIHESMTINDQVESTAKGKKDKKKKRKREDVQLEDIYFSKLSKSEAKEREREEAKKAKTTTTPTTTISRGETTGLAIVKPLAEDDQDAQDAEKPDEQGSQDKSGSDSDAEEATQGLNDNPAELVHESASKIDRELAKAKATLFVGNLPTSVITSSAHYSALKALFKPFGTIKSIRFRSIAFSELLPRKVAFLQGKFHPERDTLNAYIVFSNDTEARACLKDGNLNGHHFMNLKHLRVDSVAHPAPHENKKCVFVGSLPFDAQDEQLWTHFSQAGQVESVRVIRDKTTNVGKGFAYVQYADASSVQNALLLHEKKLPTADGKSGRKLRVTRATKAPSKFEATRREGDKIRNEELKPRDKAKLGRVRNLMGTAAGAQLKKLQREIALEGERAKKGDDKLINRKKKKSKGSLERSKARARSWMKENTAASTVAPKIGAKETSKK